ncbi:DUF3153 domain-containing protein [Laceyella putida]|uniref:DUF3153 domain-containing protein n=1 Tax=Laceyella putida TaxID=110101 RepID=A0ABW2RN57_9BACL
MHRKGLTLCCLILLLFTLSGCVNGHLHVTVRPDGSGIYELKVETNRLLLTQFAPLRGRLERFGYQMTEIKHGDDVGWIARKEVKSLKATPPGPEFQTISPLAILQVEDRRIDLQKGIWFHQARLHANVDMTRLNGLNLPQLNQFVQDEADLRFILTLPLKPRVHNATSVSADGKTLTWKIVPGKVTPIDLSVRYPNFIAWGFTLLILILLLITGWMIKRKKRKQPPPPESFRWG